MCSEYWTVWWFVVHSYESNIGKDPEKERVKPKFASTILFVEDYLLTVVSQDGAFADRKQNKLTYEVRITDYRNTDTVQVQNYIEMVSGYRE